MTGQIKLAPIQFDHKPRAVTIDPGQIFFPPCPSRIWTDIQVIDLPFTYLLISAVFLSGVTFKLLPVSLVNTLIAEIK